MCVHTGKVGGVSVFLPVCPAMGEDLGDAKAQCHCHCRPLVNGKCHAPAPAPFSPAAFSVGVFRRPIYIYIENYRQREEERLGGRVACLQKVGEWEVAQVFFLLEKGTGKVQAGYKAQGEERQGKESAEACSVRCAKSEKEDRDGES